MGKAVVRKVGGPLIQFAVFTRKRLGTRFSGFDGVEPFVRFIDAEVKCEALYPDIHYEDFSRVLTFDIEWFEGCAGQELLSTVINREIPRRLYANRPNNTYLPVRF